MHDEAVGVVDKQPSEPVLWRVVEEFGSLDDVFSRFTEGADSLEYLAIHIAYQQVKNIDEVYPSLVDEDIRVFGSGQERKL